MSAPWSMVMARWPLPSSAPESWPSVEPLGVKARIGAQPVRRLEIHDQERHRAVGLGLQDEAAVEFQRRAEQRRQHDGLAEQLADRRRDNRAWSGYRRARGRAGSGGRADRAQATSNGSTASSTGTDDGARIGASGEILMSEDCEVMALYLGSAGTKRKGLEDERSLSSSPRTRGTQNPRPALCDERLSDRENERSRGMGPCFRRDDDGHPRSTIV